jgi:hypothetical protein
MKNESVTHSIDILLPPGCIQMPPLCAACMVNDDSHWFLVGLFRSDVVATAYVADSLGRFRRPIPSADSGYGVEFLIRKGQHLNLISLHTDGAQCYRHPAFETQRCLHLARQASITLQRQTR